jgi:hypothetical protein
MVAAALVVACTGEDAVFTPPAGGDAAGPSGDAGGGGPELAPDAAASLGCPLGCLPPAPMGWTGPSAVFNDPGAAVPAPPCPSQLYVQREVEAHQAIEADPAVCTCAAGAASAVKCTAKVGLYTSNNCSTGLTETVFDIPGPTLCIDRTASQLSMKVPKPVLSGTCTFGAAAKTAAPAKLIGTDVACGLSTQGTSCADRPECTAAPPPEAPFTRLCIHTNADALCPSADYGVRILAYRNVDDVRACGACGGAPTGKCGNAFGLKGSCNAGGTGVAAAKTFDTCHVPSTELGVTVAGATPEEVACPGTSAPTGAATLIEPVTFCCNK